MFDRLCLYFVDVCVAVTVAVLVCAVLGVGL